MPLELEKLVLTLEVVTPVHVWSGSEAIVGVDTVVYGGRVCFVDPQRYLEYVNRYRPDLLRAPEEMLKLVSDIVREASMKGVSLCSRSVDVWLRGEEVRAGSRIRLNQPLGVPATTLKGYIRTALLYKLLKEASAKGDVCSVVREGLDLSREPKNASEGLEAKFFRKPRPKKAGGFSDAFMTLQISEPAESSIRTAVSKIDVLEKASGKLVPIASQLAEVLAEGSKLRFELKIVKPLPTAYSPQQRELADIVELYRKTITAEGLVSALKEFGCDLLRFEISRIEELAKGYGGEFEYYLKLLRELDEAYCGVSKGSCAPARIGFATSKEFKTVLLILEKSCTDLYSEVKTYMSTRLEKLWDERTVKFVFTPRGSVGAGWCKLCVERS